MPGDHSQNVKYEDVEMNNYNHISSDIYAYGMLRDTDSFIHLDGTYMIAYEVRLFMLSQLCRPKYDVIN